VVAELGKEKSRERVENEVGAEAVKERSRKVGVKNVSQEGV